MYHVNNAIIMAAGTSSRFAPLSFERHKGLTLSLIHIYVYLINCNYNL